MAEAVVTLLAKTKMLKARAGEITLPRIVGMAFGAGGVNASGSVIPPSESQTNLRDELLRKNINGYSFVANNKCRYTCTLKSNELAGSFISELALYDSDGDLVAIKNFLPKGKDGDLEITLQVDDEF